MAVVKFFISNGLLSNGVENSIVQNFGTITIDPDLATRVQDQSHKYELKKVMIDCGKGSIWPSI